jgi:hypothetical protein
MESGNPVHIYLSGHACYSTFKLISLTFFVAVCYPVLSWPLPSAMSGSPTAYLLWSILACLVSTDYTLQIQNSSNMSIRSSSAFSSFTFGIMIVSNVSGGASPGDSLAHSNGLCRCVHTMCNIMSAVTLLNALPTVHLHSNSDFSHDLHSSVHIHKVQRRLFAFNLHSYMY